MAAGRECVGALRLESRHVEVSIRSVGGACWSWRWQLAEGLRWRTADGALTFANVMSIRSVGGAYWSCPMAAGGSALAHCGWNTDTSKCQLGQ